MTDSVGDLESKYQKRWPMTSIQLPTHALVRRFLDGALTHRSLARIIFGQKSKHPWPMYFSNCSLSDTLLIFSFPRSGGYAVVPVLGETGVACLLG